MLLSIFEQEWFQAILGAIALGIAGIITWAFKLFQVWLSSKIKNEKVRAAVIAVTEVVEKSVLSIQQTFVDQLKKDGKFDKDKQTEALNKAINLAISLISEETKRVITENFGSFEELLLTQIEAFVLKLPGHSGDSVIVSGKKTITG